MSNHTNHSSVHGSMRDQQKEINLKYMFSRMIEKIKKKGMKKIIEEKRNKIEKEIRKTGKEIKK